MAALLSSGPAANPAAAVTPADWPVNYWWHWAFFTVALLVSVYIVGIIIDLVDGALRARRMTTKQHFIALPAHSFVFLYAR